MRVDSASAESGNQPGELGLALLNTMMIPHNCPECNSPLPDDLTCQDHFHQLLFWENEDPAYGIVHHLSVLCYYLQHPSLYSPEGLQAARRLLADFLVRSISPGEMRHQIKDQVDSGKRQAKITRRPGTQGAYPTPVHWTMMVGDVVAAGKENYIASVNNWAASVLKSLERIP